MGVQCGGGDTVGYGYFFFSYIFYFPTFLLWLFITFIITK